MDLVDNPSESEPCRQRLQIRAGARLLRQRAEIEKRQQAASSTEIGPPSTEEEIEAFYDHKDVVFWPPEQDLAHPDPSLDALYRLLTPPTHLGGVHGAWNERSLVYAIGSASNDYAILFVSFDPAIYLKGTRPFRSRQTQLETLYRHGCDGREQERISRNRELALASYRTAHVSGIG
jgi:hypothetical protein